MIDYYCPKCGHGLDGSNCSFDRPIRSWNLARHVCPECRIPVRISGRPLIVVALAITIYTGLLLDGGRALRESMFITVPMAAIGLLRLVGQWYVWRGHTRTQAQHPSP